MNLSVLAFLVGAAVVATPDPGPAPASLAATGPTAFEIIERMDALMRGATCFSRTRMTVVTPSWKRTLEMDSWSEGTEKSFIHILSPARERDTTFLKSGKLLYQYLPAAEMRVKISPSMMMQSWMGSDFTNDDLVKESSVVKDYTHRLLGAEAADGRPCWRVELTPKPEAPVVWGRIEVLVDQEDRLPRREEFWDERGQKVRVLEFSDVRRANDRPFPMRWSLTPLDKEGRTTVMETLSIEFDAKLPGHVFTLKNLEKPR